MALEELWARAALLTTKVVVTSGSVAQADAGHSLRSALIGLMERHGTRNESGDGNSCRQGEYSKG
ncbi:hypothetical protein ACPOL_4243 [Acidisarcina polymorpha]|uniref:Uncharacterized protein n=1 Tax=Acidisarcina polymorpha TaxID=2211140 RepID=A0A2Z5G341_9BACT|nr:hypothetical protein ACPOL_4243 [Acidisarcina polymorpha]